ncbi:ribonuclease HII [Helicobacter didelphidarum]|uniref:Ribonuclease n=1 Tax=Helicobacter didelphidarum TaxID=2040648 RepID=A0A3D8IH48_9HELI|nr:ribonuclease HII [Helicobacter didelphidarum]RDU64236.1 ribonuclease HII [Helicobacter didelphidarum]
MHKIFCGIDEAGRGCIAGSLFIAAVILSHDKIDRFRALGIRDSKQLNYKERMNKKDSINDFLRSNHGISMILNFSAQEIDKYGLSKCMQKGLTTLYNFALTNQSCEVIFDGNTNFGIQNLQTLIKGDSKNILIAAASILAKCAKDCEMIEYDKLFPQYEFKNHKGYLTAIHKERIKKYGYCEIHRKSYHIKNLELPTTNLF